MLVDIKLMCLGFVLASSVQAHTVSSLQCVSPVTVTIGSRVNHTGQWTARIGLEHRKMSGPWLVTTDICEEDETIRIWATISDPAKSRDRPSGYELFPSIGIYKFHPNGTTWPLARQTCAEEGAHLVIINSEKEADVMSQLFARFPKPKINAAGNNDWAWVGVHELGVDGEYYTVLGDLLNTTGFMRWVKGQPDNTDVDTAVVTFRISGGLGDARPDWIAAFVCEIDI